MNWPMCISEEFAKYHRHNHSKAKFKINEAVILRRKADPIDQNGNIFTVNGIGYGDYDDSGEPIFEYSVKGFPYLMWENELEKI